MLSRLAVPTKANGRLVAVIPLRSASHAASNLPATTNTEASDEPGFVSKILLRFRGVPLKGETERPKTMFDDVGREFVPPANALPPMPKDYKEFPERDLKNFPYPATQPFPPKTRFLVIPDSWCTPFHKVTGTSGPYLFFGGLVAFMINKELFVLEENGTMLLGWILFYLLVQNTVGYRADKWIHGKWQERVDFYKKLIQEDLKDAVDFHKTSKAETESLKAVKESFTTIFKENLALQLEATYRRNVQNVATELKRRLDYLQEVENTKNRFERDILLKSITEGVKKQIDTNEGNIRDLYLDNCIAQLKTLSAR
jgi:F-type H+-transporting ATPase subunit b